MDYLDLNAGPQPVAQTELALGFRRVFSPPTVQATSGKAASIVQSSPAPVVQLDALDPVTLAGIVGRLPRGKVVLVTPFGPTGFFREEVLYAAVTHQAETGAGVAFHLPLCGLLRQAFVLRARYLRQARLFLGKARKYGAPVVLTGGGQTKWEAKSPREHLAVATTLYGLTLPQSQYALSNRPKALLEQEGI